MQVINIEIEEKIPYVLSLTYRDETTNLPIDITGYSAILQIRSAFGSPYVLLELTSAVDGGIVLGGSSGFIDVTIPDTATDLSIQPTGWVKGVYDLVIIEPSGKRIKLAKGFVTIDRSSTI